MRCLRVILAQLKRLNPRADWDKFLKDGGWVYVAIAVAALVALFVIVVKIKDWMRPKGLAEDSPETLLLKFRDIHRQGELTADEYKSIRERLTKKSDESDRAGDASSGLSADDSAESSPASDQ